MNHKDLEQLLAWADSAGSDAAQQLHQQKAADRRDLNDLQQYLQLRTLLQGDDGVEPTPAALARALAVFKPQELPAPAASERWWQRLERFIADKVFDSRVQVAGVRYAPTASMTNLSFESPQAAVDLQIQRIESHDSDAESPSAEDFRRMMGQISPNIDPGQSSALAQRNFKVALTPRGSEAATMQTVSDEHGQFAFEAAPDRYDLHIELSDGVLVLPDIDLA